MIPQEELRIGNYALDKKTDKIVKVDGIQFSGRCVVEDNSFDDGKRGIEPEPIPLTPDILSAAGFTDNVLLLGERGVCSLDWHLITNGKYVSIAYDYDDCAYHSHNAEHGHEVKCLHQLQNLYFALTGKELEIKLLTPISP